MGSEAGAHGWLSAGTRIDHFQVIRPLGRGGAGEVYLARDLELGRQVALKLVLPESLGDQEVVERFGSTTGAAIQLMPAPAIVGTAELRDALSAADATITLFAPDDEAFEALLATDDPPDVTDPVVVSELLLAHTNLDEVLLGWGVLTVREIIDIQIQLVVDPRTR